MAAPPLAHFRIPPATQATSVASRGMKTYSESLLGHIRILGIGLELA